MNKEQREELKKSIDVVSGIEVKSEYEQIGKYTLISYVEFLLDNYDNLIKYLEDKIKEIKDECASLGHLIDKSPWYEFNLKLSGYQDILERIRNNSYD